jgi:alpha-beta hydrolase superfamily lysophospholipase
VIPAPGLLTPRDLPFPTADGLTLRSWWWDHPTATSIVVIGHGLGEHSGLYTQTAHALLTSVPCSVLAFDFRGHGRSPGRRGYVRAFTDYTLDWQAALLAAARERPGLPIFPLGHSNGGLSLLLSAVDDRLPGASGLILSNPALSIRMPVPAWQVALGHLLHVAAPWVTLSGKIPHEDLTRDPLEQNRHRSDRSLHSRVSAPLFFGMRSATSRITSHPDRLTLPLLLLLSGSDPIIDPTFTRRFFDLLPSPAKTLLEYPAMLHEPLTELGRESVWADIVRWLASQSRPQVPHSTETPRDRPDLRSDPEKDTN